MSTPISITAFLSDRILEDEAEVSHGGGGLLDHEDARFTRHRMATECEVKRRLVSEHQQVSTPKGNPLPCRGCQSWDQPCRTLRFLALPYAGHPDYDQGWSL